MSLSPITIEFFRKPMSMEDCAVATFRTEQLAGPMCHEVFREIARQIAERYVAENYQTIVEKISPDAIATLSAAEAGAAIRKTLEEKIPDRVVEVERRKTEVWQRGVLGGMKRIL